MVFKKQSKKTFLSKGEFMKLLLASMAMIFGLSAFAADGVYTAPNGDTYPWCTENAIDPDNDGWGWENEASCKVSADTPVADAPEVEPKPEGPSERGVDDLPIKNGRPTYGEGRTCGGYGVVGAGRGRVCCTGDFFHDDDDSWSRESTYVVRTPKRRYFADAGSPSCARNKAILHCAFENPLKLCEDNAKPWG